MNKLYLFSFVIILFAACKDKPAEEAISETVDQTQTETLVQNQNPSGANANPYELPDPCSLLTKDEISDIFKVNSGVIDYKPGMAGQGQEFTKSCFITWELDGEKLGFLLQAMKNPLYGEFDGWATSYINVLSTNGEMSYPENIPHVYETISGLGDAGVYNKDLGKMYWRYGDEMVIGMIFRHDSHKADLKKTGMKLGEIIQKKLNK